MKEQATQRAQRGPITDYTRNRYWSNQIKSDESTKEESLSFVLNIGLYTRHYNPMSVKEKCLLSNNSTSLSHSSFMHWEFRLIKKNCVFFCMAHLLNFLLGLAIYIVINVWVKVKDIPTESLFKCTTCVIYKLYYCIYIYSLCHCISIFVKYILSSSMHLYLLLYFFYIF